MNLHAENMKPDEYILNVLKTENVDFEGIRERLKDDQAIRILHAAMGLCTEAGEFLDTVKAYLIYGKTLDGTNLIEELGDGDWYKALALDALQTRFEEMWERNIAKLKARYGEKFNEEGAINRDLDNERNILEGEILHFNTHGLDIDGIPASRVCGAETGLMIGDITRVTCPKCKGEEVFKYVHDK